MNIHNTTPSQRVAARARIRAARTAGRVLAIAAVLALTAGAIGGAVARQNADTLPACVTEDSAGPCYWDAATMGNGLGRSFTVDAG